MSSAFIASPVALLPGSRFVTPRSRVSPSISVFLPRKHFARAHVRAHYGEDGLQISNSPSALPQTESFTITPRPSVCPETDQAAGSSAWQDPAYAGGDAGGSGSSGGGSGGSEGDDGFAGHPQSDASLSAFLAEKSATLADVPADILSAYRNGYIGLDALSNYFTASANFLSRFLMTCGPGMRNRFLADKLFLLKIIIEEGIGVFGKLSAEYEQRRAKFWKEGEFVFANLITAVLADFALVYLPAPSVALTRASGKGGIQEWLANLSTSLPSNIFQTDRAFTVAQRAGGFALKASQLFVVGMMCCLVGSVVTNSLVFVRERVDKSYAPKTEKPNPVIVSLLYATFLGLSSGSRYQLVNGIESHIFPRIFANTPRVVEEVSTFALRYGNTFWGSQQWVMFCRFTNVQKSKAE